MKRIALQIFLTVCGVTLVLSPQAAAKANAATTTYMAWPSAFWDMSKCDDGGGSAVCAASATVNPTGTISTLGSLRPAVAIATGGRAEGRGGPRLGHRLTSAYSAVRYRFYFEDVAATAQKEPALARDIDARAFVAGYVTHQSCDACTAQAEIHVADSDPLSLAPEHVNGTAWRVEVEMRNPLGKVPKGWTSATGYVLSDVALYEHVQAFTSRAQASASGRLVRVEVEPVL
jgi:hypothetical protein